jgi:hypothetical protein
MKTAEQYEAKIADMETVNSTLKAAFFASMPSANNIKCVYDLLGDVNQKWGTQL